MAKRTFKVWVVIDTYAIGGAEPISICGGAWTKDSALHYHGPLGEGEKLMEGELTLSPPKKRARRK